MRYAPAKNRTRQPSHILCHIHFPLFFNVLAKKFGGWPSFMHQDGEREIASLAQRGARTQVDGKESFLNTATL
jgi:hypothetical protein